MTELFSHFPLELSVILKSQTSIFDPLNRSVVQLLFLLLDQRVSELIIDLENLSSLGDHVGLRLLGTPGIRHR